MISLMTSLVIRGELTDAGQLAGRVVEGEEALAAATKVRAELRLRVRLRCEAQWGRA